MDIKSFEASPYKGQIKEAVQLANSLRTDAKKPLDISFSEIIQKKFATSPESFYASLGINTSVDSVSNLFNTDDTNDLRWLLPEIFRDALRLGLRRSAIWPNIIAAEESISQTSIKIPHIQMSASNPRYVGEAEQITEGTLTFGEKTVSVKKIGKGIKIPYEVMNYVSLDVVSIFLEDFGNQLGLAQDVMAIDTIINGEQSNGSEAAPIIGTTTGVVATKAYKDYLRAWIRMARLGRRPNTIIGGENSALGTLDLAEFKTNQFGKNPAGIPSSSNLTLMTPVPANSNYFIHGNVPANKEIILDPKSCLLKLNAQPLLVESEKIVSNQTMAWYATLTTGFAKLYTDSALILNAADTIVNLPFPAAMDVDAQENVVIL